MSRLRSALCILLMLTILPWGAHSGGLAAYLSAARAHVHAAQAVTAPQATAQTTAQRTSQPTPVRLMVSAVSGHKTCRTATLPGSSCGPDGLITADPVPPRVDLTATRAALYDDWHGVGHSPVPPRDPPRPV